MLSQSWRLGKKQNPANRLYAALRKRVNQRLIGWLARHALSGNGKYVLEAGCGTAEGAHFLGSRPEVELSVALDLDHEALKVAKQRSPRACLVQGDLFRLPFKPGMFDLVWNSSTIEHIHDKRRVIHEMVHATKSGGKIFIGVPYASGPLFFQKWIAFSAVGKWIGHLFDQSALAVDIEGIGLELEEFTTYFFRMFLGCLARKQ